MKKNYVLKYYETFAHHPAEYHEEEFQTEHEVREALRNLFFSSGVEQVEVSRNVIFEDFWVEMYELGLDK